MISKSNGVPLIPAYGGKLVDLTAAGQERAELLRLAGELASLQLPPRSLCDLELMATGALSPLDRFMSRADYMGVVGGMRLAGGTLYPIPVTLGASSLEGLREGAHIVLRSPKNNPLAIMLVEEIFERDLKAEAEAICGPNLEEHPLAIEMNSWGRYCLSGPVQVIDLPEHRDFPELRRTPAQVRRALSAMGRSNVVAFQTRNPMHRADEELTKRAAAEVSGNLLIHPVVGITKPGDVEHYTRVRTYKSLVENYYDPASTILSIFPLAMRLAGPREAVWHAIIRRNYGANHLILGRDHAGPGRNSAGKPFYGPDEARDLVIRHADELGIRGLPYDEMVYLPDSGSYEQVSVVPAGARVLSISGAEVREKYLSQGRPLPDWFTRPETAAVLANAYPARAQQGFCIWFTGLPSAGKSTIAEALSIMLMERGRRLTILDGDVVRTHLSKGLGFSREDRDANILRIGFVASEIVRHNGAAICAAVSPYRDTRNQVRALMPADAFIEVFIDTPVDVCAVRDAKGFYAKARAGEIKGFTGVDDPYEAPLKPEIRLETTEKKPEDLAASIVRFLEGRGFLQAETKASSSATPFLGLADAAGAQRAAAS
jgi:sulfate adenylyltransferase